MWALAQPLWTCIGLISHLGLNSLLTLALTPISIYCLPAGTEVLKGGKKQAKASSGKPGKPAHQLNGLRFGTPARR